MADELTSRGVSLAAAGLLAIVDLSIIVQRTALTGSASFFDIFMLAPGIHRQQAASDVNGGELPITGAMTSGYVFRVENQATVSFLQRIGRTGHLVNVGVVRRDAEGRSSRYRREFAANALYFIGLLLTPAALAFLATIQDLWAIAFVVMLMLARFINVVVIKRRTVKGWKGIKEEGVQGDLLTLLSQDRWVRLQGLVDDLKEVTSGQWLRDQTATEGFATTFSTIMVYIAVILAFNASTVGSLIIGFLLLSSTALLGSCNSSTRKLQMFDCIVYQVGEPKKYERRLHMAEELIKETGRDDWAIGIGLIVPPKGEVQGVSV